MARYLEVAELMLAPSFRLSTCSTFDYEPCGCATLDSERFASQPSLRPLRCKFPMALKIKKSPLTPLERTLTRKCVAKSFAIHCYKFKGLKLPWNDTLTKNRGVGGSLRSGNRGKFGEELVPSIIRRSKFGLFTSKLSGVAFSRRVASNTR